MAKGIGGWPAPEIAKVDATLPEQWWQPQALACLEGALSSLCLPGMPASLGASPHQGEPSCLLQHICAGWLVMSVEVEAIASFWRLVSCLETAQDQPCHACFDPVVCKHMLIRLLRSVHALCVVLCVTPDFKKG